MQASCHLQNFRMQEPLHEVDAFYLPPFPTLDPFLMVQSHGTNPSGRSTDEQKVTWEPVTPSTISFSSTGSPMSQQDSHSCQADSSPTSGHSLTDDGSDLKLKLMELENEMLGPDPDTVGILEMGKRRRKSMDMLPRDGLQKILIACARAVSDCDVLAAEALRHELCQRVSVRGEPIERLGAYVSEALAARYKGTTIVQKPNFHMHALFEACPYYKFGCMAANGAIAEAMKDETQVHIIDIQISQVTQWIILIRAFASRPGGPPHIRITGTYDPTLSGSIASIVSTAKAKLLEEARLVRVPLEFQAVAMSGSKVLAEQLRVRPHEALAVNFAFVLHRLSDESVDTRNHRDRLLRLAKSLSPRVVTLVEQEANMNTAPFLPRFLEMLDYYKAVFESLDTSLGQDDQARIGIEQHCLARDIMNIVACEGGQRVERHELHGKWRSRFSMAGFAPRPLNSYMNHAIGEILHQNYSHKYRIKEVDGVLYLGWMNRNLVTACAWR